MTEHNPRSGVSVEARHFVCACLDPSPDRRPFASALRNHAFVRDAHSRIAQLTSAGAASAAAAFEPLASADKWPPSEPLPKAQRAATPADVPLPTALETEQAFTVGDNDDVLAEPTPSPSHGGGGARQFSDVGVGAHSVVTEPVANPRREWRDIEPGGEARPRTSFFFFVLFLRSSFFFVLRSSSSSSSSSFSFFFVLLLLFFLLLFLLRWCCCCWLLLASMLAAGRCDANPVHLTHQNYLHFPPHTPYHKFLTPYAHCLSSLSN